MRRIDLNVDIGEGFPYDEALLEFATSANVCCGGYAGSPDTEARTVDLCRKRGVRVGGHPGYPDPAGFGRRSAQEAGADSLEWAVRTCEAYRSFAETHAPAYLKPHGALYNESAQTLVDKPEMGPVSRGPAWAVRIMLHSYPCPLMGLPGTSHESLSLFASRVANGRGFIREGFADRRYREDGSLVPRSQADALLVDRDEISAQVLRLATQVDSICLHGDNPDCLEFAELVFRTLNDNGWEVGH